MSLFSWFENLFGGKWTNETVVQYEGDTVDHGTYSFEDHIKQLRERRPTLHQTQRLLVDSKIRELEYAITSQRARDLEAERQKLEAQKRRVFDELAASQRRADEAHKVKPRESSPSKPVTGNVIAKPPKFDYESDNSGWTTPASVSHSYTPSHSSSHSHSSHSSSHSCSGSSHSHSDSGGGGGGGSCD